MTRLQRAGNVVFGLLMIACGILLLTNPSDGLYLAVVILGDALLLAGIRSLVQYATLARHMVNGKTLLYVGILQIDLSLVAIMYYGDPAIVVALYLVGSSLLAGGIGLVQSLKEKSFGARWKLDLLRNVVLLATGIASLFFLKMPNVLIALYCAWLFISAAFRIMSAFRTTDIVYIA